MLEGGLVPSVVATIHTLWRQARCKHGPWLKDHYSTLPRNVPSAHCKQCWKAVPQAHVRARAETLDEYVERATSAGSTREDAVAVWYSAPRL